MMHQAQPKSAATRKDARTVRSSSRPIRRVRTLLSTGFEAGYDPTFVQPQAGHAYASTTSLYTSVSADFKQKTVQQMIARRIAKTAEVPDA